MQSNTPLKRSIRNVTNNFFLACVVKAMNTFPVQAQLVTTDFPRSPRPVEATSPQMHAFVGMWVTEDGHIRHALLSNGRYDEARGFRESAYQGRYRVTGDIIQYWDDTGFYADGQFRDDVLYHGGYIFYREAED